MSTSIVYVSWFIFILAWINASLLSKILTRDCHNTVHISCPFNIRIYTRIAQVTVKPTSSSESSLSPTPTTQPEQNANPTLAPPESSSSIPSIVPSVLPSTLPSSIKSSSSPSVFGASDNDRCCEAGETRMKAYNDCKEYYWCLYGEALDDLVGVGAGYEFNEEIQNWAHAGTFECIVDDCGSSPNQLTKSPSPHPTSVIPFTESPSDSPSSFPSNIPSEEASSMPTVNDDEEDDPILSSVPSVSPSQSLRGSSKSPAPSSSVETDSPTQGPSSIPSELQKNEPTSSPESTKTSPADKTIIGYYAGWQWYVALHIQAYSNYNCCSILRLRLL